MSPALYRVEGEFARGGLGRILSAQDLRLAREVALKESLSQDPAINRRFVREALITARLQHPAIIPVYQAGRWPSGAPFYTMRRVAGRSLADKIQETQSGPGDAGAQLSSRLALLPRLLSAIDAVAYAHHRGVIHRDLKPENILIGDFGETVVIDWGLAKDLDDRAAGDPVAGVTPALSAAFGAPSQSGRETAFGAILGTAEFMPPEQAEGSPVDRRADVYAIGAILYELLAGRAAYLGETPMAVLLQVLHGPPPALSTHQPGLPRDLCALVAKAMARAPEERYADAGALAEDLRRFLTGQLVAAHRYSALERLRRTVLRYRAAVAVGLLGLLALLVTGALSLQRVVSARRAAESAYHQATRRANALLLLQARASLRSDPTAALAWLKLYPAAGPAWSEAHAIASEAAGRGVARHVLRGHRGAVNHAAWSPTGDRVVSCGADGTVRSFDLSTGAGEGVVLGSHDGNEAVSAVAFAPDGRLVASAGGDGAVRLWDPHRQHPARALQGHRGRVGGARFSPDGATLLSFGEDGTARLWDLAQGTQRVLTGQTDEILQAIFVSGGARVVSGGRDRTAHLVTVASGAGQVLAAQPRLVVRRHRTAWPQPTGHSDHITDLAASANGRWLASGSRDRTVWLWDLATAEGRVFATHPALVTRVAFSQDGETLATASQDGVVRLYAVPSGAERVLTRHPSAVVTLAFSPDGGTLASGGSDPSVRLSDVKTGVTRSLLGHGGAVTHLSFSPDGAWLLSASRDGTLRVWPSGSGRGQSFAGHSDHVTHLTFSPDGQTLATASRDRTVRLWDLRSGGARVLREHEDAVAKLAWSPDGRTLATASNDDTARLWQVADDAPTLVLRGHSSDLMGVTFSSDGATVATASVDRTVRLWRRSDGQALRVLRGPTGGIWTLAFTPKGTGIFGAGLDRAVYFWGLWRGAAVEPVVYRGHGGSIDAIAVDPRGDYAASAGGDGTVRTWPVPDQGSAPAVLRGHDAPVGVLSFAPDGSLASGAQDGGVFLWELSTGGSLHGIPLGRCTGAVSAMTFSPDGALLAAAARDGTARVWTRHSGAVRIVALSGPLRTLAFSPDGTALALGSEAAEVRVVPLSALPLIPAAPAALREWLAFTTSARVADAETN